MQNLTAPMISAFTAGILLILQIILMIGAAAARGRAQQPVGDAGQPDLVRAIRRHGNMAENAAIFIIAVALLEMLGGGRLWVATLCGLFVLGRICHAVGFSQANTTNPFRMVGASLTLLVGIVLGLRLVLLAWPHL